MIDFQCITPKHQTNTQELKKIKEFDIFFILAYKSLQIPRFAALASC